jgi:hypothetical protein
MRFTYGTTVLHSSRNLLLAAVMCATSPNNLR